jgi:catechol 2,3-dioxygenase-like lactoylglutathione lyase family enzyme
MGALTVQNKYVGDIGDFVKYGLLRALLPGHKLGVAWYLFPDEPDDGAGGFTGYLKEPERWRARDEDLFDELRQIVESNRNVAAIENSNLLKGARFASELLSSDIGSDAERGDWRGQWFSRVLSQIDGCDLIFADPDNGLYEPEIPESLSDPIGWKRLPIEEARVLAEGRTAVFYHHNTRRKGGVELDIDRWAELLGRRTIALRWRAISGRSFLIVNPTPRIEKQLEAFAAAWSPDAQIFYPNSSTDLVSPELVSSITSRKEHTFPAQGMELTKLLVVKDLEKSRIFYREVLGAVEVREYGGTSCVFEFLENWILLATGGEPTEDKPSIYFGPPTDPDKVSSDLTVRVPDCLAAYEVLLSRGAEFLTPPVDWGGEIRAFFRDPDGHLWEISEAVGS